MVLLLCLWQIGCTPAPLQSLSDAAPAVLTHVLKQEGSAAAPEYRIATTPSDLQSAWVIRQGTRLQTVPQRELTPGDQIWTGPRAIAVLRFANGSAVYLRPNSHIGIGSVFAFVGELFVRVKGLFQVDMEFVTAGAEGTEYVIRVLPNAETQCIVLQGRVRVAPKSQRWRPVSVRANEQVVTRGEGYREVRAASPRDIATIKYWVSQIDQRVSGER